MAKIIRTTTVPMSLDTFCKGMLRELSEKYEVIGISSPDQELNIVSEREGIRVIAVPMERRISLFKDIVSLWRMWRVFRKEKPTMVHSMTPKAGLISMVSAWLARVPIRVHTFTGLVWPATSVIKKKILILTDKMTCACATHVTPEGEGVKKDLIAGNITKKPLKVLGYGNVRGVDMDYYSRRPEVMTLANKLIDDGVFTFVFVGRVVKDKGIDELCNAFKRLHDKYPQTRCWLVGPFEDSIDPIGQQARDIIFNSENGMESVGQKSGDELLAYYAAANCFVFPSYREGFPNTVLEAGAMGLPSIVTDINGSREIIVAGENGVIIPVRDENALFEAMVDLVKDNNKCNIMASNARRMIADRFEQKYVRKCLYDFYEELLEPYV